MDTDLNPFTPGSGRRPPALEGRDKQLAGFNSLVARSKLGRYDRGTMLSGLRGVGKTTLLNAMLAHADEQDWLTIMIEARPNEAGNAAVRQRLGQEFALGLRRYSRRHQVERVFEPLLGLAHNFTVAVGMGPATAELGITPAAGSGDIGLDLEELIEEICLVLKKRGTAFGLFIDEMQDIDPDLLGALLAVQHRANQREWPFFLIGAGLPNLPATLAATRSYAERQFVFNTVGPLEPAAAAEALRNPVSSQGAAITDDAVDVLVVAGGGYPYFLQEFGQAIWNVAAMAPFTADDAQLAVEVGRAALDQGFFPSRWDRATDRERRYLRAIALTHEETPRSGKVAEIMGSTPQGVTAARDSTITKGLTWAPDHGRIAFTVPGMADFILRQPVE